MTTQNRARTVLAAAVLAVGAASALGGCETVNGTGNQGTSTAGRNTGTQGVYPGYGVVQSIELAQPDNSRTAGGIGVGTIAGAVAGGLLGSQIGGGRGQLAATAAGAAGGAYAGHAYDNRPQQASANLYRYSIRMENGSIQSVTQDTGGGIRVGDRVRIDNGAAQRY